MNPSPQAQRELQRVSVANPKGIASLSPGLRGTSYPGIEVSSIHNPEGVAAAPSIGHDHSADIQRALIDSVVEILNQGETLLTDIDNESYTVKLPAAFNASIGGHYRHCLDHFRSLFEASSTGDLNYDHRERGTLIESDRFAALNATRELRANIHLLSTNSLSRGLNVTCKTSYSTAGSQSAPSTVGREIMYVVAHAVHHFALIGIMGGLMGLKMPDGFGVAPSTLKYQRSEGAKIRSAD